MTSADWFKAAHDLEATAQMMLDCAKEMRQMAIEMKSTIDHSRRFVSVPTEIAAPQILKEHGTAMRLQDVSNLLITQGFPWKYSITALNTHISRGFGVRIKKGLIKRVGPALYVWVKE